ncbi:MAG: hypothetical protein K2O65_09735 [Lachnospiraceae bacterium]|nr:hypothetical protein [Lachnospiraceae bacterium]
MPEQSKALGHDDESGFLFAKEMLAGDVTAAVNFDRLMRHPQQGFIIMEYLLCEEEQMQKHNITPYTSHPNRYWDKNRRKFLSLWRAALDLRGTLYLVNYAKSGTEFEDQILLIKIKGMNEKGIFDQECTQFTRRNFQTWFRDLNRACLGPEESILARTPIYVRKGFYHSKNNCSFMRGKADYYTFDESETWIYGRYRACKECYPNENNQ